MYLLPPQSTPPDPLLHCTTLFRCSCREDALRERSNARYASSASSSSAGSLAGLAVCDTLHCRFQFARIDVHRPRQMGRPGLYVQAAHSLCSPIGSVGDAVDELRSEERRVGTGCDSTCRSRV